MPKLLPLPLGVAVSVPVVPETLALKLFCRLWPPCSAIRTVHELEPLTERFTLNRSVHSWPLLSPTLHSSALTGAGVVVMPRLGQAEQEAVGVLVLPFL